MPEDAYNFLKTGKFENKLEGAIPWPIRLEGALNDSATYRFTMEFVADDISKHVSVDINWAGKWDAITGHMGSD
jgi:hypothetical protein